MSLSSLLRPLALIAALLPVTVGCASLNDVVSAKHEGTAKIYETNFDQAWEAAKTTFRWEGSDAIEEHQEDGYMLTSSGMNMVSWGTVMGAWVDVVDEERCEVTVVTKRRMAVNVATTLTETTFHETFAKALEILKSGEKLPLSKPEDESESE